MSEAVITQSPQADQTAAGVTAASSSAAAVPQSGTAALPARPVSDNGSVAPHNRRWWLYILIAIAVLAAVYFFGVRPRQELYKVTGARADAAKTALPIVEVVTAFSAGSVQQLSLPGTVTPAITVHIYGQAAGFIKARYVDIGDTVHRGQLLAVISSPELDATVLQQRSLTQASTDYLVRQRSQEALAQVTFDRIHLLVTRGVLSQQDDDVARAALVAAAADVHSAQNAEGAAAAALQHVIAMASFEQVRSPIDGTVTARNIDVGSLVVGTGAGLGVPPAPVAGAGGVTTGGAQGGELFQIANVHDLRTFVAVPEQDAPYMGVSQKATLAFSEIPGAKFDATTIRSTESLSQTTRTLLLEMRIADPRHLLRPGMYATVQIGFTEPDPGILVSGDSVITLARGQFVAVVENNVVHMRQVHVGRDLGTQVYITNGLANGDATVVNPTDAVQEGVHVVAKAAPQGQAK